MHDMLGFQGLIYSFGMRAYCLSGVLQGGADEG